MADFINSGLDRRRFLKAAGLAGLTLSFPSSFARAQSTPERPRNIIFMIAEQGWVYKQWAMRPPGAPPTLSSMDNLWSPSRYDYPEDDRWEMPLGDLEEAQFSRGMRPLHRHRRRILALDGLSMLTTSLDPHGDDHARGHVASMTGAPAREAYDGVKSRASRPSVDQVIARALRLADPQLTDLTSLEFYVTPWYTSSVARFHHFIYGYNPAGGTAPPVSIPAETDPRAAFDRVFGGFRGETVDPVVAAQSRVLSVARRQFERIEPRLSGADRQKLEAHRALIRDLEVRFEQIGQAVCTPPARMVHRSPQNDELRYQHNLDSFIDLAAAAVGCGLSRVATVQFTNPPHAILGSSGDLHHDYAHPSTPEAEYGSGDAFNRWVNANEIMCRHMEYYGTQVARLADRLEAIPDGRGGSMLDSTMIVWVNEIAHGGHGHDQWPVVIVGGDAFRSGRWIRWPKNNPTASRLNYGPQFVGHPHTQLLVSLCQAMGVPIEDFGHSSVTGRVERGPHRGMTRQIALGGPLEGLI